MAERAALKNAGSRLMGRLGIVLQERLRHGWLFAALVFVNAPIIIVILVSFSSSSVFDLPVNGLSLRWYAKLANSESFTGPLVTSLKVAFVATLLSVLLGGLCALGLWRSKFRGRELLIGFALSPMMLPGVVIGISLLFYLRSLGITNSFVSLCIAHTVITIPYAIRISLSGLSLFDAGLIDAARTLGCSPRAAVLRVLVPNIAPSLASAAVFSFLASLDNYSIALFLGDVYTVTLPIQIINALSVGADPMLAAVSTILLLSTLASFMLTERLIGLQRIAGA
jgi:putative spermidine/putrescine transport system permease protein